MKIEKIETAVEPKFQDHFVNAMAIPNKSDPFPILFAAVDRPAPRDRGSNAESPRRRRRKRVS